jgi:hypothetical protein
VQEHPDYPEEVAVTGDSPDLRSFPFVFMTGYKLVRFSHKEREQQHRGRIGVLCSNKDYGCEWDDDWRNKRFQREDNTKFAVNVVVYAMTS